MTRKRRRLNLLIFCLIGIAAAAALSLNAMRDTLVFFYTPSDIAADHIATDRVMRIGGMVEKGSVKRAGDSVTFTVTDYKTTLPVTYTGVLPDLFREGQGVVAEGKLANGVFDAGTILAKHDERYMPPEVAKELGPTLGGAGAEHHATDTLER